MVGDPEDRRLHNQSRRLERILSKLQAAAEASSKWLGRQSVLFDLASLSTTLLLLLSLSLSTPSTSFNWIDLDKQTLGR